jgi:hypothetical protein
MVDLYGLEQLTADLQRFVSNKHQELGPLSLLVCKRVVGLESFETVGYTKAKGVLPMMLTEKRHRDYFCADTELFEDEWTLKFEEYRASVVEVVDLAGEKKNSVTAEGFPVSSEIPHNEALYISCTPSGVYLKGEKLVLRDGEWHLK